MKDSRAVTFKPGDPVCDAIFSGRKGLATRDRQFREGPIELINGHWSHDWSTLMVKKDLADEASRLWTPNVDEMGRVYGNGIRSNFYGLQHVNGFGMLPATYPLADNRLAREQAGLANDFVQPWHKTALISLIRLVFRDLEPVPMPLKEGSSSMAPYMETKMTQKQNIARLALQNAQVSAKMMMRGDFITPWVQHQIGGAYIVVYRHQSSDSITKEKDGGWTAKPRKVADLEYALTGGKKGVYQAANKEMGEVDFRVPDGFFRERKRTAMGGPLGMNAALMPIAHSVRKAMYHRYPFTWHHTTREQQQNDIRKWKFMIATDVTQHDQFWPTFILPTIAQAMQEEGVADWWAKLYMVKSQLPIYITDVAPGDGNILIGDWRNPDLHVGLPSGNALTDLEGSWLMTWVYALIQIEHTAPQFISQFSTVEKGMMFWDSYLSGKLPILIKDKSDDALLGWQDEAYVPQAIKLMEKLDDAEKKGLQGTISPYMNITLERGGAFLGSIILYPESKNFANVVMCGNGLSLLINQLSPEYGVQSAIKDRSRVRRPFPGLAWETLPLNYGTSPLFGELMELLEKHWYDKKGESYRGFRERLLHEDKILLQKHIEANNIKLALGDLTLIDQEVIADPDKLQYKYTPDDVTPGVLQLLFKGLTLPEVEPYFRSAYHA